MSRVADDAGKATYERVAALADTMTDPGQQEEFAALLDHLTEPMSEYRNVRRAVAVRRWLKDAGWVKR